MPRKSSRTPSQPPHSLCVLRAGDRRQCCSTKATRPAQRLIRASQESPALVWDWPQAKHTATYSQMSWSTARQAELIHGMLSAYAQGAAGQKHIPAAHRFQKTDLTCVPPICGSPTSGEKTNVLYIVLVRPNPDSSRFGLCVYQTPKKRIL